MRWMAVGALGTHVKVQKKRSLSTPSAVDRGRSLCSAGRSVRWCCVSPAGSGPALGMKSGLVSHVGCNGTGTWRPLVTRDHLFLSPRMRCNGIGNYD